MTVPRVYNKFRYDLSLFVQAQIVTTKSFKQIGLLGWLEVWVYVIRTEKPVNQNRVKANKTKLTSAGIKKHVLRMSSDAKLRGRPTSYSKSKSDEFSEFRL